MVFLDGMVCLACSSKTLVMILALPSSPAVRVLSKPRSLRCNVRVGASGAFRAVLGARPCSGIPDVKEQSGISQFGGCTRLGKGS